MKTTPHLPLKGSYMVPSHGALERGPLIYPRLQGPILQNPLKEVRDQIEGPLNYS